MSILYSPTCHEQSLAKAIVDCAYIVHMTLGPGLLETVYEHCLCLELQKRAISYRRQVPVPLVYDGIKLPWACVWMC